MKRIIAAVALVAATFGLVGAMATPASAATVCVKLNVNGQSIVDQCI